MKRISTQKVPFSLDLHPDDYRRLSETARAAEMTEKEFGALAIHRGICILKKELQSDVAPPLVRSVMQKTPASKLPKKTGMGHRDRDKEA